MIAYLKKEIHKSSLNMNKKLFPKGVLHNAADFTNDLGLTKVEYVPIVQKVIRIIPILYENYIDLTSS